MLVVVNSSYGLAVAVGLLILGVPDAILFGVLAGLVRFIPYVGPWVGAVLPIAMSLAVFDSWNRPLTIIGLFIVLELVSNNIIEPWLYGSRTGISTVGVIVAAVFWGWLWGPVGLIMATPLTVCLVVMGRYVPRLEFFSVLLGDGPSLPPQAKVYQRLLAADYDDVFHFTHEYLKANTVTDLYQNVLMPALAMAEHDRQAGRLEEGQDQFIYQSLRDLIEELGDLQKLAVKNATAGSAAAPVVVAGGAMIPAPVDTLGSLAPITAITEPGPIPGLEPIARPGPPEGLVLCIAARDEADEISALMLVQLLEFQGISARVIAATTLAGELIDEMEALPPKSVCVCAMPPAATSHARYMCKRILARFEDMKVVVAIWNSPDLDRAKERIRTSGTDRVVANFGDAIDMLR